MAAGFAGRDQRLVLGREAFAQHIAEQFGIALAEGGGDIDAEHAAELRIQDPVAEIAVLEEQAVRHRVDDGAQLVLQRLEPASAQELVERQHQDAP